MKKTLAIVLAILIAGCWFVTFMGIGSFAPIKDQLKLGLDLKGGVSVVMEAQTDATGSELKTLMQQTQAIIEKRVNQMGLSEPVVTIEGEKRIRVELPGADDADQAIKQIGKTAQLQFIMADGTVVLDGSQVKDAGVAKNQGKNDISLDTGYVVTLEFNAEGSKAFKAATERIVNNQVTSTVPGMEANQIMILLDGQVLSNPKVTQIISGQAEISGNFTNEAAANLAVLIRGGALPVGLEEVDTTTVGPTLGIDSLKGSVLAGMIGVALIIVFMIAMYRVMGLAADIALLLYILIVLWVMAAFNAVLTLPGIAGMILGVGMAVDANVIIFSRIREEVKNGKSIRVAAHEGFKRAMSTVIDSQVTTMIAAVVLYQLGSGPVRGFAMTLMISIVGSIFTAVVITQLYLSIFAESKTFGNNKFFGIKEVQ
ncbi:protein translocase subunit SecD [Anaerovorax sp. IOR16]|uniref:protein translocase subunit SecD n=1 Tax=Anaerovorax sp. IOR16 TaxID=2773458 RepID=UPI0019D10C6C|nr:protein translocase subunit SecD [Anaerovorax sp. IOR16]